MSIGNPLVPTCLTGSIVKAPPISHCKDGATHLLIWGFVPLTLRLIPQNKDVEKALNNAVGQYQTVCGYLQKPVEPGCDAMLVYDVLNAETFAEKIKLSA